MDYLEKVKMVRGLYYDELLGWFNAKLLFHHDKALVHIFAVATNKLIELGWWLTPSDFFISKLEI